MCLFYKVRDFFSSPLNTLKEVNIIEGHTVLDFGCGPGSFSINASRLVGDGGKIYALDLNPMAVEKVKCKIIKEGLNNIETINSDCRTGFPDDSVDIILLYDAYHDFYNRLLVLKELNRVLKTEGILSFSDHHMRREEILKELTGKGLFRLIRESKKTYSFVKSDINPINI